MDFKVITNPDPTFKSLSDQISRQLIESKQELFRSVAMMALGKYADYPRVRGNMSIRFTPSKGLDASEDVYFREQKLGEIRLEKTGEYEYRWVFEPTPSKHEA